MKPLLLPGWTLPVSLFLNIFLLAAFLAHYTPWLIEGRANFGPPPPPPIERIIEEIATTLPPADAALLRSAFARQEATLKTGFDQKHALPTRIRTLLLAPQIDLPALRMIFADDRAAQIKIETAVQAIAEEVLPRLSEQGRKQLALFRPHHPPHGPPMDGPPMGGAGPRPPF
jgi:uncharacterized membrane protein